MGRPPSNEFFIKKAWNWTDTRDLWEGSGKDFETFLDAAHSAGVLKKPSYDSFDEFQNAYKTDNDSTFDRRWTSGWYNPLSYGKAENAALVGKMNKEIYTAGKKYYDAQAKQRNRQVAAAPEQVNNTPGSFTTSTGATVTSTPVTQDTTGTPAQAPAEKSVNDMSTREYLDYQAQHAAEDIDTIVRTQGVTPAEARRIYYAMHNDNRYYGYHGQTPPSTQPAQPQQPQADQQQGPRGYQGGTVTVNGNTYPANDPVTGAPFVTEVYGVPRYANKPNPSQQQPAQPQQQGQQQPQQQGQQQPQQQPAQPQQSQQGQQQQSSSPWVMRNGQLVTAEQADRMKTSDELSKIINKPSRNFSIGGNGYSKAASLAKSFAAGRFSSDEAGDNKVTDNRAALWNRFNGD